MNKEKEKNMEIKLSNTFSEIYEKNTFFYFLNGWKRSERIIEVYSPIDQSLLARVYSPNLDDLKVDLINELKLEERIKILKDASKELKNHKEEFIDVLVKEVGKPLSNAKGEVNASIKRLELVDRDVEKLKDEIIDGKEIGDKTIGIVKRVPLGKILAISPFNYPLFTTVSKFVPAFLSGNSVIIKPSSLTPISVLMFGRLLEVVGLSKEFSILPLKGSETETLLNFVDGISLTGSTETGKSIISKAGIKEFHMELGGKDFTLVLKDADPVMTTEEIVKGAFAFSGQRCDSIRIVIIEKEIYGELKSKLVEKTKEIRIGNPFETDYGPLITLESAKRVEEMYKDALEKGAQPLVQMRREKNYVYPTIIEVDKENIERMKLFTEDLFGPLLTLVRVSDAKEGIDIMKKCRFALDASIFGHDEKRIKELIREIKVGEIFVNMHPRHGVGFYPFGGMKDSGIGRDGIGYSIERMTTTKTIVRKK